MDRFEPMFNFQKICYFAFKKGAYFGSLLQEKSSFCPFKRGEILVYFFKKSILNSAPGRPVLTRGACLSRGILLGLTLGSDSSLSPYKGAVILAPLRVSPYIWGLYCLIHLSTRSLQLELIYCLSHFYQEGSDSFFAAEAY